MPQAWNLYEFTELLLAHGASIPMVAANTVVLYNSSYNIDHLKRYVRHNLGKYKLLLSNLGNVYM